MEKTVLVTSIILITNLIFYGGSIAYIYKKEQQINEMLDQIQPAVEQIKDISDEISYIRQKFKRSK
jgi:hypothetical protein